MDHFNSEIVREEGHDDVHDEQMLIDFHLGNAINLDVVDYLVRGTDPGYSLYIPHYMTRSWNELSSALPPHYKKEVGFLEITCTLMSLPSRRSLMGPKLYKQLVNIIGGALKKRGVCIPLAENYTRISSAEIMVKSTYDRIFNRIMKAMGCLSEKIRGGSRCIYPEVTLNGQWASVELLSGDYPAELLVGRNLSCIIDHARGRCYVGNYDSVLLLLDTIGQRMCMEIGCQITSITDTAGTVDLVELHEIISKGDRILTLMGNDGYEVLGLFEATVVSIILKQSQDSITDPEKFYNNCMDELVELTRGHPAEEQVLTIWTELVDQMMGFECDVLSNLFCLYRIWGHPRVNILTGMKKVYDKGTYEKFTLGQSSNVSLCQFRHMFLSAYYNRKKSYPSLKLNMVPHSYVLDCLNRGLPINPKNTGYNIWDYMNVEIGQVWTIPETYDVCHILNDKAVSPTKSELYRSIQEGKGTIAGVLRRGIIRWMEGDSIRCKDFLEDVDQNGIEDDHLIIGMYEKEREIKVKARMFSLMSEKMRMYFVLTEELIANHILPFFPEITMKDPLNVQIRKIWKAGGKGQNPLNPNINIDFEKWNLNMRPAFTNALFRQMDKMFGFTNLIARTHDIFYHSYIYSCSGKYLPKITPDGFLHEPPMSYSGHLGGFEGLRQKGWTVATVVLLAYTAWANKVQMRLLGQGDNQVLKLYMPIKRWENLCYTKEAQIRAAKEILQAYLEDMHKCFADAGLPIKVRETWISTRLFMYGKSMYLDGRCLPQWSKKLLRSYALSNEGTLTISGVVGTIATNMNAAASVSEHPDIMYAIYMFLAEWSLEYMLAYHPFTRSHWEPGKTYEFRIPGYNRGQPVRTNPLIMSRLITTLILIPTAVGGSVNIPLTGFITRGFPDHASEGYAWVKLLRSVPSVFQSLFSNWYTFLRNPSMEPDMLVQSPWSLNHLKPPTPGLQSRELVRDWLLSGRFPKNKFLTNMSEIHSVFDRKGVCHELMSDPINPLVTYEVYNAFPHTYYDSVLRRFEGTRSVRKLALREHYTRPIVKKLMEVEDMYIAYLIWRGEITGSKFSDCATAQTRMARDIGWGRSIHGLTTPHPIEFLFDSLCHGYSPSCDGSDFILAKYAANGDYPPYLGSRVKTKVISLQDEAARVEPLICANARLARYLKWLNAGPNLFDLILTSTSSLCNVDIYDNFFDDPNGGENYSGCIEHRFNPAAASDGCFINYVPQIGSSVYMSGDFMPTYGKGKDNYTLHFQAIYCFLQYTTAMGPHSTSTHHHIKCQDCVRKCDDQINDISDDHPYIDKAFSESIIPVLRKTIGYISQKPVVLAGGTTPDLVGVHKDIGDDPYVSTKAYFGVLQLLSVRCASPIMLKSHGDQGLGIDDLQAFPRVYAYKIYTDHIIRATAEMLIFMQALHSGEQPEGYVLQRVKHQVKKALDSSTLDKFKELGSICLGRSWSTPQSILGPIPCSSYPESPEEFLRSVRSTLVRAIDEIISFDAWIPKTIAYPKYDCTERELKLSLGLQIYRNDQCWTCGMLGAFSGSILDHSCREGHLPLWINRTIILKATLDRMMKLASVKRPKNLSVDAIPIITSTRIYSNISDVKLPEEDISKYIQRRKINIPTASIYKWTAILSQISESFDHVIVLGDGTGGTSLVASSHWGEAKIHPLSKMEHYRAIPQDSASISPYLSRGCKNVTYELMHALDDNILASNWEDDMIDALTKIGGEVLIISDIERGLEAHTYKSVLRICQVRFIKYVIKVYKHADPLGGKELMLVTSHANLGYSETFITNCEGIYTHDVTDGDLLQEMHRIEACFGDVCALSLHLARQHLARLYLNIKTNVLIGSPKILLQDVMSHVNARYRFPQDRIKVSDKRNITDGILIKLVRSIKILLLSMTSETIKSQDWFNSLCLIRCHKSRRIRVLRRYKIIISADRPGFAPLDDRDILAARTIRGYRKRIITLDSMEDLYCYILRIYDGDSINRQHEDDVSLEDAIEGLEDY